MEKYHGRRAQRFSIRKYSFGAASVLLGTALLLGANAVKADETSTASTKNFRSYKILINRNQIQP